MEPDADGVNTGDPPVSEESLQTKFDCTSEVEISAENAIEETKLVVETNAEEEIAENHVLISENLENSFEDAEVNLADSYLPIDSGSESSEISIECSSIKIGGYQYTPLGPLVISTEEMKFAAPSLLDGEYFCFYCLNFYILVTTN